MSVWPSPALPAGCPHCSFDDLGIPCAERIPVGYGEMIVRAFSAPGAVVACPRPAAAVLIAAARADRAGYALVPDAAAARELRTRLQAELEPLQRAAVTVRVGTASAVIGGADSPAGRASLVVLPPACRSGGEISRSDGARGEDPFAASQLLLRPGGLLAVLTRDAPAGKPGGAEDRPLDGGAGEVIARARDAGLVYLQHIVALHAPIRDGQLHPPPTPNDPPDHIAARPGHGPGVPPRRHQPVHTDLIVFCKPGGHPA